jgi:hypothetical protein
MKKDPTTPDKEEAPRGVVRGFSTARRTRSARVAFNCNDRVSEAAVWRCGRTHTRLTKTPDGELAGQCKYHRDHKIALSATPSPSWQPVWVFQKKRPRPCARRPGPAGNDSQPIW